MHTEAADFLGGLRPVRNRNVEDEVEEWVGCMGVVNWEFCMQLLDQPWALFEWHDGLLVTAMKRGGYLLVDEISLAEDAVLERMNSVLEPEGKLLVAERGVHASEVCMADVAAACRRRLNCRMWSRCMKSLPSLASHFWLP